MVYPLVLGGSVIAVTWLATRIHPVWAMNVVNCSAGLVILLAELALPYRSDWNRARGDVPTDLAYLVFSGALVLAASIPVMAACSAAALWLGAQAGGTLWPTHWPLIAQLPLALLIYELGSYGLHRVCHHTRLWRLHSVHHSVERLWWLNSVRSHPIDFFLAVTVTSGPLLVLGAGELLFAQVTVIGTVNMWLQHANIDARTGPLDWVMMTPRLHRWHHSRLEHEQQCNLGAVLIVWDIVFRSRLAPADREPPEQVGPGIDRYPQTFLAQLSVPFRRAPWRQEAAG